MTSVKNMTVLYATIPSDVRSLANKLFFQMCLGRLCGKLILLGMVTLQLTGFLDQGR